MLQHTREGKDTRWSNWRERKFFIMCAHVFAELWSLSTTIYVSTTYQYLVQRKLALSWQAMMGILQGIYMRATNTWWRRSATFPEDQWLTTGQRWICSNSSSCIFPVSLLHISSQTPLCIFTFVNTFRLCPDRRKSWTDGSTEQTNAIQRWLKDSKIQRWRFSCNFLWPLPIVCFLPKNCRDWK